MNELMKVPQTLQQASISVITVFAIIALSHVLPLPIHIRFLFTSFIDLKGSSGHMTLSSDAGTALVITGPGGRGMIKVEVSPNGSPLISMQSADGVSSLEVILPPDGVPVISSTKPPKFRGWEYPG
jgi:hypothetical protein